MALFDIPKEHLDAFRFIFVDLTGDEKRKFIEAINALPLSSRFSDAKKVMINELKFDEKMAENIVEAFSGFAGALARKSDSEEEFIADFIKTLKHENIENEQLEETLDEILGRASFMFLKAKAVYLVFENQNTLSKCAIITNAIPLFNDQQKSNLFGFVPIHNLKIEYRCDDRDKSIYFALDADDLDKLGDAVRLAKIKQVGIEKKLLEFGSQIISSQ